MELPFFSISGRFVANQFNPSLPLQYPQWKVSFHPPRQVTLRPLQVSRRPNSAISHLEFWNVMDGIYFANSQGIILNGDLVLMPSALGVADESQCHVIFSVFIDRLRAWCRQHRHPCVYWYCWENARDRGLHVHIQLYVSPERQAGFREWAAESYRSLAGGYASGAKLYLKLRRNARLVNQYASTRYMMKGLYPRSVIQTDLSDAEALRSLRIRTRQQGVVPWKRTGISRSISKGARVKAGYLAPTMNTGNSYDDTWHIGPYESYLARQAQRETDDLMRSIFGSGSQL